MSNETPYRLTIVALMAVAVAIAAYHRWQAASGERISHREEGYAFTAVLRLAGVAMWVSVLAYLLAPAAVRGAALPWPAWLRWLGAPLGALGTGLLYWTLTSLGKNLTDTVVTRANATLVTHGPYRWVRHPFYVSAAILMLAVTLLSASAWIGASGLATLLLLAFRTPKEEQLLIARFGDDYREYMARTGRYWPR